MQIYIKYYLIIFMIVMGSSCYDSHDEKQYAWSNVEQKPNPTNHSNLYKQSNFEDGPAVTRACLECHPEAAKEVMQTSHWTWLGEETTVPGHIRPMRIGKKNLINNFCISIESNWPKCTKCHAGYGWKDSSFDFSSQENVDCLVCHDRSGGYIKGANGLPAKDVDLLLAAKSVGRPTRDNCGWCHFNGGGGNAVKHGDLDGSLANPHPRTDVHMGQHDFQCIDCHKANKHRVSGKLISVNTTGIDETKCTDCHSSAPHQNDRLDGHVKSLACQSCHLPEFAKKEATKMAWDWSTAGQNSMVNDPHKYLKTKGSFVYATNVQPEYYWFNGNSDRYIKGDKIDPAKTTHINKPQGDILDPGAKIWPFKVHRAKQPYDVKNKHLLVPKTVGQGGYWTEFDWDLAVRLGSKESGIEYSGEVGFTKTKMFWLQSHMISPKEQAVGCIECHSENGRLDWQALGYDFDPAIGGGRSSKKQIHPKIRLLDKNGQAVTDINQPLSLMKTCSECHDTDYIAKHNYHSQAGYNEPFEAGRAFDTSPGMFGRFEPLINRYLTPSGDDKLDMGTADWVKTMGPRHVGGGPAQFSRYDKKKELQGITDWPPNDPEAHVIDPTSGQPIAWNWQESGSVELNCLICHIDQPNNQARIKEIESGHFNWASSATLLGRGIIERDGDQLHWNNNAFDADGYLVANDLNIVSPNNSNCLYCHNRANQSKDKLYLENNTDNWALETTGTLYHPDHISGSAMNLEGKQELNRPWDVHAARMLKCTDCHYSMNNPKYLQKENETTRPKHLKFDPRLPEIDDYLQNPNHNFAKGHSSQGTVAAKLDGSMRNCSACHDAGAGHDFLPYKELHFEKLSCQACHIPETHAPARKSTDWTVITTDGNPRVEHRGVEGKINDPKTLISGYYPALLMQPQDNQSMKLVPHNLITNWFWVEGNSERPVRLFDLKKAYLDQDGKYHPEIIQVFDKDNDQQISSDELKLDSQEKIAAVTKRLEEASVVGPKIKGEIQPYTIGHGTVEGKAALDCCQCCHSYESRITQDITLSSFAPGNQIPKLIADSKTSLKGNIYLGDGQVVFSPTIDPENLYIHGTNHLHWMDIVGIIIVLITLSFISIHAGLRVLAHRRRNQGV
jgi:octaheme c-type cytochrome (tetrathionate reductase family)